MSIFHTTDGFFKAIEDGDLKLVKKYLSSKRKEYWLSRSNSEYDDSSPLFKAIRGQNVDMARLLFENGAKFEYREITEIAERKSLTFAAFVLECGYSVDELHQCCIRKSFVEGVELCEKTGGMTASKTLLRALEFRSYDVIHWALPRVASYDDLANDNKSTALHLACDSSISNDVFDKILAESPGLINRQDSYGRTPLHIALSQKKLYFVKQLLRQGARTDIESNDGFNAIEYAQSIKDAEIIAAVLDKAPVQHKAPQPDSSEYSIEWKRLGTHQLASVETLVSLNRKITTLFNFAARERQQIFENIATRQEKVMPAEPFEKLDTNYLRGVFEIYKAQQGTLDSDAVFNTTVTALPLKLRG